MKKQLKYIIVIAIVSFMGYLGFKVGRKIVDKKEIAQTLKTLPEFVFQNLDGTPFANTNLQANTITILIYFNSTCDFCQHEAQSISESLEQFTDIQFLFVSTEDVATIKQFAEKYKLNNQPKITFLYDSTDAFSNAFDANSIPYMLIYDQQQNLIKSHKGQLNASGILKILNAD